MKNPNELNRDELELVLNILKSFNHQMYDYSDVYVGNIIYAQAISNKAWMPDDFRNVPHNVVTLLENISDYGFIEKAKGIGAFAITAFGREYLLSHI